MRCFRLLLLALTVSTTLLQADEPPRDDPAKPAEDAETPIVSGKLRLELDPGGEIGRISSVLFTPDGKQLITASNSGIRFRDVATGQTLRVLRMLRPPQTAGPNPALALSADGQKLAVAGNFSQREGFVPVIALVALADGRVERILKGPRLHQNINTVALSPDGRLAAAASHDKTLRVWQLTQDEPPLVIKLTVPVYRLVFSPDSKQLLEGAGRVWDVTTGMVVAQLREEGRRDSNGAAWSPDGKTAATWGDQFTRLKLWEPDGKLRHHLLTKEMPVAAVFSPDARHLLVATRKGGKNSSSRLVTVDVQTGKEARSVALEERLSPNVGDVVEFSPRGDLAVTIEDTHPRFPQLVLWKTTDGSILHHFGIAPWLGEGAKESGVGWNADGKGIAWWKPKGTGKASPKKAQPAAAKVEPGAFDLTELRFAPPPAEAERQGRVLKHGSIELIENGVFKDGQRLSVFQGASFRPIDYQTSTLVGQDRAALVGNPSKVGVAGPIKPVCVFDVNTGKLLHQLRHETHMNAMAASPGGRYLATVAQDQILRLWNAETGKRLLMLFVVGQEWILWTEEGYYAASPGGEKLILWVAETGSEHLSSYHPAQRFRKDFFRPDVIKLVMEKGSVEEALKAAGIKQAKQLEQVLPPAVTLRSRQEGARVSIEVVAQAGSTGQPINELQLLVDGRPVKLENGQLAVKVFAPPQEKDGKGEWSLTLEPGLHKLSVRATARDTYSISEDVIADVPLPMAVPKNNKHGTLYYVGIGVNQFQHEPALKLTGAVPDVLAMEKCLKETCKDRYGEIKPTVLTDGNATLEAILKTLTDLPKTLKPTDVVIVHYSSHGEVEEGGGLFLLCHDTKRNDMKGTAVPGEKLRDVLGQYPCPVLLILDACHSGKFPLMRPATDPLSRLLADDSCGVAVMTAALAHQKAVDTEKGGVFTQALVEGLQGKADPDKVSKQLYVHHLFTYVFDSVARQTANKQMPLYLPSGSVPPIVLKEAETK